MPHLDDARRYIAALREGEEGNLLYKEWIKYIREEMIAGALTLSDIGTSEEELEKLRTKGCAAVARSRLNWLRRYPYDGLWWNLAFGVLQNELKSGNLHPEAIGSSEEELAQINTRGHKATAIMWLDMLRKIPDPIHLSYLKESLDMAKLSFADINTNDEEINRLVPLSERN